MHAKFERLLSKSLTTLEVMAYYLVVHTGPDRELSVFNPTNIGSFGGNLTGMAERRGGARMGLFERYDVIYTRN